MDTRVMQIYKGFVLNPSRVSGGWVVVADGWPVTYAIDLRVAREIVDRLTAGYAY
jgi:hypothetical protein